jgi:uncharacterized protein YcfL
MKKTIIKNATSLFLMALLLVSCSSSAQKGDKEQEKIIEAEKKAAAADAELENARQEYLIELSKFRDETSLKVERNNQMISDLKKQAVSEKQTINSESEARIQQLEKRNSELKDRLDKFDDTNQGDWERFKAELNRDFNDLGESISNFFTRSNKK